MKTNGQAGQTRKPPAKPHSLTWEAKPDAAHRLGCDGRTIQRLFIDNQVEAVKGRIRRLFVRWGPYRGAYARRSDVTALIETQARSQGRVS